MGICQLVCRIVSSVILWTILVLLCGPPFLVLWLYKRAVVTFACCINSKLEPLNSADFMLVDAPSQVPQYNIGVLLLLGKRTSGSPLKVHELRKSLSELISSSKNSDSENYDKLQKVLTSFGGYFFWAKDDNFDVEHHVTEKTLDRREDLEEFLSNWIKSSYPCPVKPAWELLLIKMSGSEPALAFRIHHSYADGLSIMKLVSRLCGVSQDEELRLPKPSLLTKVWFTLIFPHLLIGFIRKILASQHEFNKSTEREDKSIITFFSISSSRIKAIKAKLKVPFSSIPLNLTGSVFAKLLSDHLEKIPEIVCAGHALPWPGRTESLGNQWTAAAFKVYLRKNGLDDSAKLTGQDIKEVLNSGFSIGFKTIMMPLMSLVPLPFIYQFIKPKNTIPLGPLPLVTGALVFSTESEDLRILGHQVLQTYPLSSNAVPHMTLAFISVTRGDILDCTVICDRSYFPDATFEKLRSMFVSNLFELESSLNLTR